VRTVISPREFVSETNRVKQIFQHISSICTVHWFVLREKPFEFADQSGTVSWLFLLAVSFDQILWQFVLIIITAKKSENDWPVRRVGRTVFD